MFDPALIDQVRALIADPAGAGALLDDTTIDTYLALNLNADGTPNVRLAAAEALESIAVSELLVSKKIRTQDLATDGPAVSAELRALAKRLRDRVALDSAAADTFDGFDIVDTIPAYVTGM